MVDEGRSADISNRPWEDSGGRAAWMIVATAVAAGVIAFIVRRSREPEEPTHGMAKLAREWAGSDGVEAGRDFVMDKIVPELKPALLSAVSELEDIVDQAFRRIEKNIKKM